MKKRFLISLMVVMAMLLISGNLFAVDPVTVKGEARVIGGDESDLTITVQDYGSSGDTLLTDWTYSWDPDAGGAGLDSFTIEIDSAALVGAGSADNARIRILLTADPGFTPTQIFSWDLDSATAISPDDVTADPDEDSLFYAAPSTYYSNVSEVGTPAEIATFFASDSSIFRFYMAPSIAADTLGIIPDANYAPTRNILAASGMFGSTDLGEGVRIHLSNPNDATYGTSQITQIALVARDFTTKAIFAGDTLFIAKSGAPNDSIFETSGIVGGNPAWDDFQDSLAARGATHVDFQAVMMSAEGNTVGTIATTNGVWIDREAPEAPNFDDIVIRDNNGDVVDFAVTPLREGYQYTMEFTVPDAISSLTDANIVFNYHGTGNVLGLGGGQGDLDITDAVISGDGQVITFTFTPNDGIGATPFWYKMQLDMDFTDVNGNVATTMNDEVTHWTLLNRNVFVTGVEIMDYTKDPDDPDTLEWGNVYRVIGDDFDTPHVGGDVNFIALREGLDESDGVFALDDDADVVAGPPDTDTDWFKLNGEMLSPCLMAGKSDTTFLPGWQYYIMGTNSMNDNTDIPWGDVFVSNYAFDGDDSLGWAGVRDLLLGGDAAGMIDSIFVHDSKYPELAILSFAGDDVDTVNSFIIADTATGDNIHENALSIWVDAVKDTMGLEQVQIWYRKHESDPSCYPDKCQWILLTTVNTDSVPWEFDVDLSKLEFDASRYEFAAVGIDDRDDIGNYFSPNRQPIEPQETLYIERGEEAPTGTLAANTAVPFEYGGTNKVDWTVADDFFVKSYTVSSGALSASITATDVGLASKGGTFTVDNLQTTDIGNDVTFTLLVEDYYGLTKTVTLDVPVVNEIVDVVIDSLNNGVPQVGWPWTNETFADLDDDDTPVHIHGDSVNIHITVDDAGTDVDLYTKVGTGGTWAKLGTVDAGDPGLLNWNVNALTDGDTIMIAGVSSDADASDIIPANVVTTVVDHHALAAGDLSTPLTADQIVDYDTEPDVTTTLTDLVTMTVDPDPDFTGKSEGSYTVKVTGTDGSVPNANTATVSLVTVIVDDVPTHVPAVDDFTVNEKAMSHAEIAAGNALFELTVSDGGSGIDGIFAYIELDHDDGQTAEDSVLFDVTGLGGLAEHTITNTIDVSTWAKDSFQVYLEVTDLAGNVLEDNTHSFSILENNTLPVPVIAAIDEHDQENEDCSVTLYAFTGLCLPNAYQKEPDHLRFEYKNGNGVWIEFGNVDFADSYQPVGSKYRIWAVEFNYDAEDGGYYDDEVRAVAVANKFTDDMGETPYDFVESAGPALVPHTVYDNNRVPMDDADQKLYSDNAVESPTNIVLVLTESNESGPQGNTINEFELVSTEMINGMFRGVLGTDPADYLDTAPTAGTVTVWSFNSYNVNQPDFTYTLNAGVMDVTKLYDAHDQVAVSYDGIMTIEAPASTMDSDELVYFEPFRNKTVNGIHIHTTLSDQEVLPITMIHNTDISEMTTPAAHVWRWATIDGVTKWWDEDSINSNTAINDTVYNIAVSEQGTVSFMGTFVDDAIYAVTVYDDYTPPPPPVPYAGPVANFQLLDFNGDDNGLDDDHVGYAPHKARFGICGDGTDCAGDDLYFTPASGEGAGSAADHEIMFMFDGTHQVTFMADECCKAVPWEESYAGTIDSTFGAPLFTYMEPGSYDVTMIITDTKGGGADTLTIPDYVVVKAKDLAIEAATLMPSYSNAEGVTYTSKCPELEVQVAYPHEQEEALLVHVYLNGHHVVHRSTPKEGFTWNGFNELEGTFAVACTSETVNKFLFEDKVNEIYVVVFDEAAGLTVTSETIEFWLDMTNPLVHAYDEDDDYILGTGGANTEDAYIFVDAKDPESHIRITNCQMVVSDKNDQDAMTYPGETFFLVEEMADGFVIKKNINFSSFNHALFNDDNDEADGFSNDITVELTIANRLGMETVVNYDFSFDLMKPTARLADEYAWPTVMTDSSMFDNDEDGYANEDPIDGINNDGDWHDVNGNGRRDYYSNNWCETVYNCCGDSLRTICHQEVLLEEEYIDEDPIDYYYYNPEYQMDCNSGLYLHLVVDDPEGCTDICDYEIFSPASGVDHESFKLYIDGEETDATLDMNGGVVGGQDGVEHGDHQVMLTVSDHAGKQAIPLAFRIHANHDVAIVDEAPAPEKFELGDNYPNPFNPTTNIKLSIKHQTNVTLSVYDLMGKKVKEMQWDNMDAGYHTVTFDAHGLATGVYIYTLKAGNFVDTKKMILLK